MQVMFSVIEEYQISSRSNSVCLFCAFIHSHVSKIAEDSCQGCIKFKIHKLEIGEEKNEQDKNRKEKQKND